MNKETQLKDLGSMPFNEAWELQDRYFNHILDIKSENRRQGVSKTTPNFLFTVEHPHVYTLGKNGDRSNLLIDDDKLREVGAEYIPINRGGDITYHGPGQIVMYPVIDLENFFTDLGKYLRTLEEAVIRLLAKYGITAGRLEGYTGVWLDPEDEEKARKICAMGVKTSRWVTMHGIAFNVNTDLDYFKNIIPCGIKDKQVTSLEKELGSKMDIAKLRKELVEETMDIFDMSSSPFVALEH